MQFSSVPKPIPFFLCRRHLHQGTTQIPPEVVEKLFVAADEDGDGVLEYQEFMKWVKKTVRCQKWPAILFPCCALVFFSKIMREEAQKKEISYIISLFLRPSIVHSVERQVNWMKL